MTDTMQIYIAAGTLGDGSKVYNVIAGDLVLPAVSLRDAVELASLLRDGVTRHTNIDVTLY